MKESDIIAKTDEAFGEPVNFTRLSVDLVRLGVRIGDILLVHSSLSAIGWITGGGETLIRALFSVVGESGTLVMPAHSGALSDPGLWENPPVPPSWHEKVREGMPPFNPLITPTRGVGTVPELFRRFPGVIRSSHPMDSFCAYGPEADRICESQVLENGLGEESPLARIYELGGRILLIGCGHDSNTSLHLAEFRSEWPGKKRIRQGCPVSENGCREWKWFKELDLDTGDFPACGRAFEDFAGECHTSGGYPEESEFNQGRIGLAESRLMSQPALVDFASEWFTANRKNTAETSS